MLGVVIFLVGTIPACILMSAVAGYFRSARIMEYEQEAVEQLDSLAVHLAETDYFAGGGGNEALYERFSVLSNLYDAELMAVSSDFLVLASSNPAYEQRYLAMSGAIKCISDKRMQSFRLPENRYFLAMPVYVKQENGSAVQNADAIIATQPISGALVMICSLDRLDTMLSAYDNNTELIMLLCLLLMAPLSVLLTWLLLRPFNSMYQYFTRVSRGDYTLPEQGEVIGYRETDELKEMVNATVSKLSEIDRARGEFVQNVSHELKTPLTSVKILADSLKGMENVPLEMYQEFISDISTEVDRENKIIEDLLSLVKMDKAAQSELALERVNVNELIESILKRLAPIARQDGVDVTLESRREVWAEFDGVKMTLALTNIVENAIKYNYSGGWVHVTLDANHRNCVIVISDSGAGIPKESIGHIFDRFYRVDKARSREVGGTGLGLAITKSIIDLHHGSIAVESASAFDVAKLEGANREVLENADVSVTGTVFTVTLPLKYIRPQNKEQQKAGKIKYHGHRFLMLALAVCVLLLSGCGSKDKEQLRENPYESVSAAEVPEVGEVLVYRPSLLLSALVPYRVNVDAARAAYEEAESLAASAAAESEAAESSAQAETAMEEDGALQENVPYEGGDDSTSSASSDNDGAQEGSVETGVSGAQGETAEALREQILALLWKMNAGISDDRSMAVLPEDVFVEELSVSDGILTLSLSENYLNMRADRELLARMALVKTLTQLDGVDAVRFYIAGSPMAEADGSVMPPYTAESFVE